MGYGSNVETERRVGEIRARGGMTFTINGIAVPSPNSIQCSESDFSWGHTTYTGEWVGYLIRRRKKVYWIYNAISSADLEKIHDAIESNSRNGNMFFDIQTPFAGYSQSISLRVYKGDTTTYEPVLSDKNGVKLWKVQFNWIEKAGKQYAKPGAIVN